MKKYAFWDESYAKGITGGLPNLRLKDGRRWCVIELADDGARDGRRCFNASVYVEKSFALYVQASEKFTCLLIWL